MFTEMRARVKDLPEGKRKKYAADIKTLEADQESISKVLSELGADLDSIPKDDRNAVKKQLREEAWQPTRDAIGVCCPSSKLLSCLRALLTSPPALFTSLALTLFAGICVYKYCSMERREESTLHPSRGAYCNSGCSRLWDQWR